MLSRSRITLVAAATLLAGCYHVTVNTGLPAGTTSLNKGWVSTWVIGIVPPGDDISSAQKCPSGVAKVETQWSFLNGLVHYLTYNIYTPIQVDVTCASSAKTGQVPAGAETVALKANATADEVKAAFVEAADRSQRDGVPVYVPF